MVENDGQTNLGDDYQQQTAHQPELGPQNTGTLDMDAFINFVSNYVSYSDFSCVCIFVCICRLIYSLHY